MATKLEASGKRSYFSSIGVSKKSNWEILFMLTAFVWCVLKREQKMIVPFLIIMSLVFFGFFFFGDRVSLCSSG